MKKKLPLKLIDVILIVLSLGLTGFSFGFVYLRPQDSLRVRISSSSGEWIFPLDAEERVSVSGPLGESIVRIHNKEVWMEASPCVNQLCAAQGKIHRGGGWAACLPNGIFFVIEGDAGTQNEIDAIVW